MSVPQQVSNGLIGNPSCQLCNIIPPVNETSGLAIDLGERGRSDYDALETLRRTNHDAFGTLLISTVIKEYQGTILVGGKAFFNASKPTRPSIL